VAGHAGVQPCVLPGDVSANQRVHGDFMWRQFYNMVRAATRPTAPVTSAGSTGTVLSLRALANNLIVTADNAGASALIANRTAIGSWEQFTLISDN
jgi:hypothetical protein